jgi:hypothetical protein
MPARLNGEESQGQLYPQLEVPGRSNPFSTKISPTSVLYLCAETKFHRICGKSGSDAQEKSKEERDFHWVQGVNALGRGKSAIARRKTFS